MLYSTTPSTLDDVWTFLAEGTEVEGEDYSEEEAISGSMYYNDEETQQRTVSTAEQQLTTDTEQHQQQYGSSEAAEGVDYELLTGVLDQLTSESVSVKCLYLTS